MALLHDDEFINLLCNTTNVLADEIKTITGRMEGRGCTPAESPLIIKRLTDVELILRKIGCNKNELIPGINRTYGTYDAMRDVGSKDPIKDPRL